MRSNILFVCMLTFVEVWNFISSVDIRFTKYEFDSGLAGYRCIPNETAFDAENITNSHECSKLCHVNNICVSFSYKPDSYQCIGCRVNLGIRPSSYESYPGSLYFRTKKFSETNCKEISENYPFATSGLYTIYLRKSKKISTVYCDMDTDDGGWTVFQNRFNGPVDFSRNFLEYENGFGALNGEFWLGLKIVQEMTSQGKTELRFDATTTGKKKITETYQNFYLDKGPNYTLHLGTPGTTDRRFLYNNGSHFTTYDVDKDGRTTINCASQYHGGWWYYGCTYLYINGRYGDERMLYELEVGHYLLKTSKLMFR